MKIKESKIKFYPEVPFRADLYHVKKIMPHFHEDCLELIYCIEGSVDFVTGFQTGTLKPGEIFSIDGEDIHYLYSNKPNTVLVFHLDLKNLHIPWENIRYVFFACESGHCFEYQKLPMRKVTDIILSLSYMYFKKMPERKCFEKAVTELTDILYRYFNYYNYDNRDGYVNPELHSRFFKVIGYCYEHYDSRISIEQAADCAHVSKNYLSQFFGKTPFKSFSAMLKNIRSYKAERLLLTTGMSNTEIAYACGFSDPKYFYAAFDMWWGCSPYTHRKNYEKYTAYTEEYECVTGEDAFDVIKQAIINWHIYKSCEGEPGKAD